MDSDDRKTLFKRLDECSFTELREWHRTLSDAAIPKRAKSTYLRGQIAWMEQARAENIEMEAFQAEMLAALSQCYTKPRPATTGTRLVREWHGKTYTVDVLSEGYGYEGEVYKSLSEIARKITGTRWSGPRFFGLKSTGNG